jgi:hypothetical protein
MAVYTKVNRNVDFAKDFLAWCESCMCITGKTPQVGKFLNERGSITIMELQKIACDLVGITKEDWMEYFITLQKQCKASLK